MTILSADALSYPFARGAGSPLDPPARFGLVRSESPASDEREPGTFVAIDLPVLTLYRRTATGWFTSRATERLRRRARQMADDLLDRLLDGPHPFDLVRRALPAFAGRPAECAAASSSFVDLSLPAGESALARTVCGGSSTEDGARGVAPRGRASTALAVAGRRPIN
jgi:hypothetical protein